MMARFEWYLNPLSPHRKTNVKIGPSPTKLSESAHGNAARTNDFADVIVQKMVHAFLTL